MNTGAYHQVASQESDGGDVELAERGGGVVSSQEEKDSKNEAEIGDDKKKEKNPSQGDVENEGGPGVVVRVLDVKKQGATVAITVNPDGCVRDLQLEIESVMEVPVNQQRLICAGQNMISDEKLSKFKIAEDADAVTVHLMRRLSEAERSAVVSSSSDSTVQNPLRNSDLNALGLALESQGNEEDSITRRIARETGRPESTIRAAARVRLLSSLLALYCALNSLACLSQQENHPAQSQDVLELGLNLGGLAVGYQGLTASRTLDLAAAERYDRSLRIFSLGMLSFEAYYYVILPSNEMNDLNNEDSTNDEFATDPPHVIQRGGGNDDHIFNFSTAATAKPHDSHDGTLPGNDEDVDTDVDDEEAVMSRDSQILSGIIVLTLWSGIWLVCVQNASRLRLDIRAHEFGTAALEAEPQLPISFAMA
mmetsp:Transcript_13797/g.18427  ORF Transcript_13797/g.18427 Transcript_13797/m.18427 type:complete len:423 (+) Transcript_13797:39-1307(+)